MKKLAILPLGGYSKEIKTEYRRNTESYVYCSTIHNNQSMGLIVVSTNRLVDKENEAYTHNRILFSYQKGWNLNHLMRQISLLYNAETSHLTTEIYTSVVSTHSKIKIKFSMTY